MNLRIITSVAVMAGLSLSLSACDKKPEPVNACQAADGSAIPCPAGAGGSRTDTGAPEQQK